MDRVVYRRPMGTLAILAVVFVLVALLLRAPTEWGFIISFVTLFGLLSSSQRLVGTAAGVEIRVLQTRQVPWSEISSLGPGSIWRGGLIVHTTTGPIWSPAPGSWWGGPARASDVEALERLRPA